MCNKEHVSQRELTEDDGNYLREGLVLYRRDRVLREIQVLDPADVHESVTLDGVQVTFHDAQLLDVHTVLHEIFRGQGRLGHPRDREETHVTHLPEVLKRHHAVLLAAQVQVVQGVLEAVEHLR